MNIHINEIKKTAVNQIKDFFPNQNHTELLKTLTKALGFKSIGHLCNSMIFDDQGFIINVKEEHQYEHSYALDLNILVFNEHVLMNRLKIRYSEALVLKNIIDKPIEFSSKSYDGNIYHSDLKRVKYGVQKIINGDRARIMADWPFSFYARRDNDKTIKYNGSPFFVSYFLFDGFSFNDINYFKKKDVNIIRYLKKFISYFLEYDNIAFTGDLLVNREKYEWDCIGFILDTYKHYIVDRNHNTKDPYDKLLIIPSKKDMLISKPVFTNYN